MHGKISMLSGLNFDYLMEGRILTKKQELLIEQSRLRETINRLLGLDELSDEQRSEMSTATDRAMELEGELRAAIVAEPEIRVTDDLDSEARERLQLRSKSSVVNYVRAAVEMRSVKDAEAEYNTALGMGVDQFPLEMLAPAEERQTTDTDTSTNQGTWLDRLFFDSAAMSLGVTFNSVSPGIASYPVTTAGATGSQYAKSGSATAAAWTVGVTELKPKRNAVHAIFSIEDAARIGPGLEDALQRDLRMAMVDSIDKSIFKGDSSPGGTDADIVGFQTAAISEVTLTQSNKLKGTEILKLLASFIDGKHAGSPADIRIVSSVGSNVLWLTTEQAAAVENQTIAQFLRASGVSWTTRGDIDTNTSNGDFGAYIGLSKGIQGAAVSAVWSQASMVRDPYSGSAKGEVGIVLSTLWDFAVPRTSNFKRIKYVS